MTPDPAACCPDAFYCPAGGETECPRHGGFDICCARPDQHVPMDLLAWHEEQERLEQEWLNDFVRGRTYYGVIGRRPRTTGCR